MDTTARLSTFVLFILVGSTVFASLMTLLFVVFSGFGGRALSPAGLAGFTAKTLTFTHFLFEVETGTLAACAEAVGMKFDQKSRKIMTFSEEDRARLGDLRLRLAA